MTGSHTPDLSPETENMGRMAWNEVWAYHYLGRDWRLDMTAEEWQLLAPCINAVFARTRKPRDDK